MTAFGSRAPVAAFSATAATMTTFAALLGGRSFFSLFLGFSDLVRHFRTGFGFTLGFMFALSRSAFTLLFNHDSQRIFILRRCEFDKKNGAAKACAQQGDATDNEKQDLEDRLFLLLAFLFGFFRSCCCGHDRVLASDCYVD